VNANALKNPSVTMTVEMEKYMEQIKPKDKMVQSIESVFHFEKSLMIYIQSTKKLIHCQKEAKLDTKVGKSAFLFLRQVNELQKLMNQKIMTFTDMSSQLDVCSVYREHPAYDYLTKEDFITLIEDTCHYAYQCSSKEWNKSQIRNEAKHAVSLYKERRNWLEIHESCKNETETVWIAFGEKSH
jgi:hypothetical protein